MKCFIKFSILINLIAVKSFPQLHVTCHVNRVDNLSTGNTEACTDLSKNIAALHLIDLDDAIETATFPNCAQRLLVLVYWGTVIIFCECQTVQLVIWKLTTIFCICDPTQMQIDAHSNIKSSKKLSIWSTLLGSCLMAIVINFPSILLAGPGEAAPNLDRATFNWLRLDIIPSNVRTICWLH